MPYGLHTPFLTIVLLLSPLDVHTIFPLILPHPLPLLNTQFDAYGHNGTSLSEA